MLQWRNAFRRPRPRPAGREETAAEQSSPGMARALERISIHRSSPEILDLGQPCGSTAVYLASRGARVSVEEFEAPGAKRIAGATEHFVAVDRVSIDQPDAKFDLVLAWEHFDFVPPDRLDEFVSEISRVMAPDGWLLLFALDGTPGNLTESRPASYRITADDRLLRTPAAGPSRPRWAHHNRAIHQALAPLVVSGVTLRRNRLREFVVHKPAH